MKVGDTVVCINDKVDGDGHVVNVTEGLEYILEATRYKPATGYGVRLVGVEAAPTSSGWFKASRFAKAKPKKATNKLSAKLVEEFKEQEIIKEVDVDEKPSPVYG